MERKKEETTQNNGMNDMQEIQFRVFLGFLSSSAATVMKRTKNYSSLPL